MKIIQCALVLWVSSVQAMDKGCQHDTASLASQLENDGVISLIPGIYFSNTAVVRDQ